MTTVNDQVIIRNRSKLQIIRENFRNFGRTKKVAFIHLKVATKVASYIMHFMGAKIPGHKKKVSGKRNPIIGLEKFSIEQSRWLE